VQHNHYVLQFRQQVAATPPDEHYALLLAPQGQRDTRYRPVTATEVAGAHAHITCTLATTPVLLCCQHSQGLWPRGELLVYVIIICMYKPPNMANVTVLGCIRPAKNLLWHLAGP
jgi:hypothetical protein